MLPFFGRILSPKCGPQKSYNVVIFWARCFGPEQCRPKMAALCCITLACRAANTLSHNVAKKWLHLQGIEAAQNNVAKKWAQCTPKMATLFPCSHVGPTFPDACVLRTGGRKTSVQTSGACLPRRPVGIALLHINILNTCMRVYIHVWSGKGPQEASQKGGECRPMSTCVEHREARNNGD